MGRQYEFTIYLFFKSTDGTNLQSARVSNGPTVQIHSLLVFQIDRRYEFTVYAYFKLTNGTNSQSTQV